METCEEKEHMYVVFLGPPGSGKGTYSKVLSELLNIPTLATGDMLRDEIEKNSALGNRVREYVQAGELVPDDVMHNVVKSALLNDSAKCGVIFDGFPRTLAQAKMLDEILQEKDAKVNLVVELQLPDDIIIKRLSNRRVCPKCGRIYHLINARPRFDEVCDDDGEKLIQRDDDKPETIRNRLKVYHAQTAPIIDYYRNRDDLKYIEVDTSGALDMGKKILVENLKNCGVID